MAAFQNFRSALNGFNREDVVRYIEFINNQHNAQVAQLNTQLQNAQEALAKAQGGANGEHDDAEKGEDEQSTIFIPGYGEIPLEWLYDKETLEREFDKMFGRPLTAADRQMIAAYLDFIKPDSNN